MILGRIGGVAIKKRVQERIIELKKVLGTIENELIHAPEGSLKIQKRQEKTYYYHQIKKDGKYIKEYIKRDNENIANALAQKAYYEKVKPLLEKELHSLEIFYNTYNENIVDDVYDSMIDARKQMICPVRTSIKEIIRQWENEEYETYQNHKENMIFETNRGEYVRSKSELIIANLLDKYDNCIKYKYERPLELGRDGRIQVIHPDFTILNVNTGKVTFWEHAGRMDDPGYVNNHMKKINLYIENGLFPGKDVIITYETMSLPLNILTVKSYIMNIIGE